MTFATALCGAAASRVAVAAEKPRLIVVVSVDQFAYEYLDRFRSNFANDGIFQRFVKEGAWFTECHHRHAFTLTGPGHSVMLTGTYPNATGIIDNQWHNRRTDKPLYCVEDAEFPIVGAPKGKSELKGVSPKNLLVPTVGDVLKKATGGKAKVFGLTLKDRAAVLMAGQNPDLAIWFDTASGNFVTSKYYRATLPKWLKEINDSQLAECFAGETWRLLYPAEQYKQHYPDEALFEGNPEALGREFPHDLADEVTSKYYKQIAFTPFGNELTLRVAEQLLAAEKLGQDDVPDLLCLGLSCNDYVGHQFGPHSLEVEDITYRTDVLLGKFLKTLDEQVGAGRWTLALTADHAVAPIPEYAATINLPGKRNPLDFKKLVAKIEATLTEKFGPAAEDYVEKAETHQIYLGQPEAKISPAQVVEMREIVRDLLRGESAVATAYTRDELLASPPRGYELIDQFRRSCNPLRSGDVLLALKPYSIMGMLPANHGSPWRYDTHVPLLWLGAGIQAGKFERQVSPAMIAPTVAKLLDIEPPSGNVETAVAEALR